MIRSLTLGLPLDALSTAEIEAQSHALLEVAHDELTAADLPARTTRLALPAVGVEGEVEGRMLSRLRFVDGLAAGLGVRWFCLPLDFVAAGPRAVRLAAALDAVVRFDRMFLNLILAKDGALAVNATQDVANLILNVSRKSRNGFDNFRVGASFQCPANAPFFPFTRHDGDRVAFSLALETVPLVLPVLHAHPAPTDLGRVRDDLAAVLTPHLEKVEATGQAIAQKTGAIYCGLDASYAPLPSESLSVAEMVEIITGTKVGGHASLLATAFLTDSIRMALQQSGATAVGFNGVMYSLLEDTRLASANSTRQLNLDALLALSTVCACGIDMVPIPGVSFPEEIAALILDVGALSCVHQKPLGVRVLPIPGGHVNDFTKLSLDFLCDSRIVALTSNERAFQTESQTTSIKTSWKESLG